jgi:SAM-dependent methyltransferase
MLNSAVRLLFGRTPPHPDKPRDSNFARMVPDVAMAVPMVSVGGKSRTAWPAARLILSNELWGAGFICPGGESEILRLARPLGVSAAASLLIVGVGSGAPATVVTRNFGAWVTGAENDPSLLATARGFVGRSQMARKIKIVAWNPDEPAFGVGNHHHCLALEPFRKGQPEPIADALARSLKPGGQMVVTELTAGTPLNPADPTVRRWAELEQRNPSDVLAAVAVPRILGRIGLDVRVAEDISDRHIDHALMGWRTMLRDLATIKPPPLQAAQMVREAELWLLRRRLVRDGRLRMMRWHAISRAPSVAAAERVI